MLWRPRVKGQDISVIPEELQTKERRQWILWFVKKTKQKNREKNAACLLKLVKNDSGFIRACLMIVLPVVAGNTVDESTERKSVNLWAVKRQTLPPDVL